MVSLGSLAWCRVSYASWGALAGCIVAVLGLWLMWRTAGNNRTVPGHPIHGVLVVPAAILACHFALHGVGGAPGALAVAGALDLSMLFYLFLLAVAVMLTQSLFPAAGRYVVTLAVCGAGMMASASAELAWGAAGQANEALALLGFAGVSVWLSLLWGLAPGPAASGVPQSLRRREVRLACIGVAGIVSLVLAGLSPVAAVWAGIVAGGVVILGALVFPGRRLVLLAIGVLLCGGGACLALVRGPGAMTFAPGQAGWFGVGEHVLTRLTADSSGLELLVGATGWVGGLWCVAGACGCAAYLLWQARRGGADQGRAMIWLAATAMASCATMAPGGLCVPAILLATAFTWGMLPAMLGHSARARHGIILLIPTGGLMLALALARSGGLILWITQAHGHGGRMLHALGGCIIAAVMVWLFGAGRRWRGLVVIAGAALLGGAGELLQPIATTWRKAELADWAAHAAGCAVVVVLYLLCIGLRRLESPDAPTRGAEAIDEWAYRMSDRTGGGKEASPNEGD